MNRICLLIALLVTGAMGGQAAGAPPLAPMNRVHAGLSVTDALGVGMGFDSRMTNIIYMDVGAFMSTGDPEADTTIPDKDGENTWLLRHGIYLAPGFRIPHKQPEKIQWDVFFRGGFSGVWAADAASDYAQVSNLGLFGGGELMIKSGNIGIRLSNKMFYFKPYSKYRENEVAVVRPQYGAEAIYQF